MADLLFSWPDLEQNIMDGDVGYLHAELAKFNEYKERSPEFIWLVRLEDKRVWLLGKLKITSMRPSNFPNKHHSQFIFYNPSESFFFRDVEAIQETTQETLDVACKVMQKRNMQGVGSLDVLEPPKQRELERLTKNSASISFDEFKQKLLDGRISSPPYRRGSAKKSTRAGSISVKNAPNKLTPGAGENSIPQTITIEEHHKSAGADSTFYGMSTALSSPDFNEGATPLDHDDELLVPPITANDQETLERDTPSLKTDEREAVVKVRFGQGGFRELLLNYKTHGEKCWMSGIEGKRLLIASHIKPWSHCKEEPDSRGNPDNGLLLSALWDTVFDAGLISFDDDYKVVASSELSESALCALNLSEHTSLPEMFRTEGRKGYLAYHRAKVFESWNKAEPKTDLS
jgi:hypothetical protein